MSDHYLRFLENEDEAQMTGYKFSVNGDQVVVSQTFHNSEYEQASWRLSKVEARKMWANLIASGKFEEIVESLSQVLVRANGTGGFLTLHDVRIIAKQDRMMMLLVRCNNCRFIAPAQNIKWLIDIIERDGQDYVRDISIPVKA